MADDKKNDKKKPTEVPTRGTFEELVFFLAGLLLLAVILNQVMNYLASQGLSGYGSVWEALLAAYLRPFWSIWKVIAVVFSAASIVWAIYSLKKLKEVRNEEKKVYGPAPESLLEELNDEKVEEKKNEKWLRVIKYAYSENPSDWRLAIIEADVMLEEVLRVSGYHGETIGDMLKAAEGSEFMNLEAAWEAHKVRNRIAHSGADFQLNERETRRAIALFETVFREFQVI